MDFFQKENCDRCSKKMMVRTMSMFNTESLCLDCKKKEEAHPSYAKAQLAEQEAIRRGNDNFSGIGLPPDLR